MEDSTKVKAAIDDAFEGTVQKLYSTLLTSFTTSQDTAEKKKAEMRFEAGLALAREARDRAKALV